MKSLLKVSSSGDERPKLPTLRQWLKTQPKELPKTLFSVKFVWLPNVYDNITLETDEFRVRVGDKSPIYKEFVEMVDNCCKNDMPIAVDLSNEEELFELVELEDYLAQWKTVGENGWERIYFAQRDSAKPTSATAKKKSGNAS